MRYRWVYLGFNHSSCSTTCPTDRYVTPTITTLPLALEFIRVYFGLSEHDLHSLIHNTVCSHSWKILSEFKCNCSYIVILTSLGTQAGTSIFTTIIRPKVIVINARSSLEKFLNMFKAKLTAFEGRKSTHCESYPNP